MIPSRRTFHSEFECTYIPYTLEIYCLLITVLDLMTAWVKKNAYKFHLDYNKYPYSRQTSLVQIAKFKRNHDAANKQPMHRAAQPRQSCASLSLRPTRAPIKSTTHSIARRISARSVTIWSAIFAMKNHKTDAEYQRNAQKGYTHAPLFDQRRRLAWWRLTIIEATRECAHRRIYLKSASSRPRADPLDALCGDTVIARNKPATETRCRERERYS